MLTLCIVKAPEDRAAAKRAAATLTLPPAASHDTPQPLRYQPQVRWLRDDDQAPRADRREAAQAVGHLLW